MDKQENKMGTIAELFQSGAQKANKGYFNNLVMLARVDGKVDDKEIKLLTRIAKRLSLTNEQVKEIIEHSDSYPMIPPVSKEERYERFIQFVHMTVVDGQVDPIEEKLAEKYGVALGIDEEEVVETFNFIADRYKLGKDRFDILEEMMKQK